MTEGQQFEVSGEMSLYKLLVLPQYLILLILIQIYEAGCVAGKTTIHLSLFKVLNPDLPLVGFKFEV